MKTLIANQADQERHAFFDRQAKWWDEKIEDSTLHPLFEEWWRTTSPKQGQTMLEIGCGTGRLLAHAARAVGSSGLVVAGDVSRPMLDRALGRCLRAHVHTAPVQLDARRLPMRRGAVDIILISNTLPHLTPLKETLGECHRALRPDGRLEIIHFASRDHINGVHIEHGGVIAQDLIPRLETLCPLLESCGFTPLRAEDKPDHFWVSAVRSPSLKGHTN